MPTQHEATPKGVAPTLQEGQLIEVEGQRGTVTLVSVQVVEVAPGVLLKEEKYLIEPETDLYPV